MCSASAKPFQVTEIRLALLGLPKFIKTIALVIASFGICVANAEETTQPVSSQQWMHIQGFLVHRLTGACIDVAGRPGQNSGAPLQLWNCERTGRNPDNNSPTDQGWETTNAGHIVNSLSGKCIDVPGASARSSGLKLQLWDCEGRGPTDQLWEFTQDGQIKSRLSGLCMDVGLQRNQVNGTPIQILECGKPSATAAAVRQIETNDTAAITDPVEDKAVNPFPQTKPVSAEQASSSVQPKNEDQPFSSFRWTKRSCGIVDGKCEPKNPDFVGDYKHLRIGISRFRYDPKGAINRGLKSGGPTCDLAFLYYSRTNEKKFDHDGQRLGCAQIEIKNGVIEGVDKIPQDVFEQKALLDKIFSMLDPKVEEFSKNDRYYFRASTVNVKPYDMAKGQFEISIPLLDSGVALKESFIPKVMNYRLGGKHRAKVEGGEGFRFILKVNGSEARAIESARAKFKLRLEDNIFGFRVTGINQKAENLHFSDTTRSIEIIPEYLRLAYLDEAGLERFMEVLLR